MSLTVLRSKVSVFLELHRKTEAVRRQALMLEDATRREHERELQEAQAEANKSIVQAQAEIRRAAAVAVEQEMKARVQEMRAQVVQAEAQVPLALAEAFRRGHLGVMDYARYQNVTADTSMRQSIAGGDNEQERKIEG